MVIGRPRTEPIRREIRHCKKHGDVEHYLDYVGRSANPRFCCAPCSRERARDLYERTRSGEWIPKSRSNANALAKPTCPTHFIQLPVTGVCDECQ